MIGSIPANVEVQSWISRYVAQTPVVIHNSTVRGPTTHNISTEGPRGMELSVDHIFAYPSSSCGRLRN